MKKLSRIIMLVVLALVMLLPVGCTITPEKGSNGLVYELDLLTNTYTVVDYKAVEEDVKIEGRKILVKEVVIPSTFNGKPVAKIDVSAFAQKYTETRHDYQEYIDFSNDKLTLDTFKANNGDLCYYAKVQKVVIPASVKTIGDFAFQNCSELKEIVLDDSITSIGNSAFAGCTELTTLSLSGVQNAQTNQLPSGLKKISDGMFFKCSSLEEVYIPSSVTKIGKLAFASCYALEDVKIERANGDFAMVGSESEVDMTDKDGVAITSIDNYAFKDAVKMQYFNVPNSVKSFGVSVFEMPKPDDKNVNSKSSLIGVSFSDQIKELGSGMFKNCISLDEEKLDLSQIEKIGSGIFEGCTSLTSVQLNGMITAIPERAYYGCTGITTVDLTKYYDSETDSYLPTQVNYIGEAAFRGCSSLRSIELGNDETSKITDIKRYAFKDCPALRSIYIPLTAIRIDPRVFENSGGTVIYAKDIVGASATGEQIVRAPGWSNGSANIIKNFVSVVKVADANGKIVAEYVILDKPGGEAPGQPNDPSDDYASLARYVDFDNTTYTVPATISYDSRDYLVEGILKSSFKNCDALEAIELDPVSQITKVESEAFANTTNVKSLDLSVTKVTAINERTFAYGKSLQSVILPADITEIKESAFEGCSSIVNLDISSVSKVGKAVFKDCVSLETVKLGAITEFSEQMFYNASKLVNIQVADISKVTSIRARAFLGCSSLNETNFPTGVMTGLTIIDSEAFSGCSGYTTFAIPEKLKTIGGKAFSGCTGLASFTIDPLNVDFVVTEDNVLFKKKTVNLTVKYFLSESEIAVDAADAKSVKVPVEFYPELTYYPANSESSSLFIDMLNTYTFAQVYNIAKEANGGNDVYAVTSDLSNFRIFNRGKDYITADGTVHYVSANRSGKITAVTKNKAQVSGITDYVVGKIGDSGIIAYAFEGAANLEEIKIYGNVTIGTGAFNNCSKLTSIEVLKASNDDKYSNLNNDGVLYNGSYVDGVFVPTSIIQFPSGCDVDRYEMPETVGSIAVNAFSNVKRIGTFVFNSKIGWDDKNYHGVDKAFENANIEKIEIPSQAAWVIDKDEEGKEIHTLQLYADGVSSDKLYDNSNGKFILDSYGILYSVNIGSETVSVDGATTTTRFLNYYQLIYVPTGIDLTGKTLTIPNECTVMPYAFAGNDTLDTIVLGRKVSMVAHSFDGCKDLTILYQSGRVDYEDMGYLNESNFVDANGEETNIAFKNAKVYYFSEDMIESDEYKFWHYKSALDDQTGAPLTYDSSVDSKVPAALNGSPVIHQDNDLLANYGYEYQLAVNEEGEYYQDAAGNWVIQTNNFGESQFVIAYWN